MAPPELTTAGAVQLFSSVDA
eukprot:COSAG02_NODE_15055_length_1209_cov_1.245045_1_plen_20_part_10